MRWQYVAYNLDEGVVRGRMEAGTEQEVRADLSMKGYKPLMLSKAFQLPNLDKLNPPKVKSGELIAFARQAATMLDSGASLLRVLDMLKKEASGSGMKKILDSIYTQVEAGDEFTTALRQFPKIFDEVFISLVEVGEYTGKLGSALEQLADIMAQEHEAKAKAMKTMMMPVFLIGSSFLMLGFMAFVALPPLLNTFEQMGVEIPLMTRIMVGSTNWLVSNILQVGIGLVVFITAYKMSRRVPSVKYAIDLGKMRLPLMGTVMLASELGKFTRIIATLLSNGVDVPASLQLALNSAKNEAMRRAWLDAQDALMTGKRVSDVLGNHKVLPTMFVELWSIGEETNTLPKTMGELADAYQKQYEDRIEGILAVAEPVSTFSVGGVVLFMALSVMKPILSASNAVGG